MPTPKKGARLGGSAKQQAHLLANLATNLFEHHTIKTTDAKAKLLRPYAEKLITKAKAGTLADRREVLKVITRKDVVSHLFDELGPKFANRNGGYTRIIKLENRTGDNAPMSQISLVLEETVSAEANRATAAAAAKAAEAEEAEATEAEAVEAEVEATEAEAVEAEAPEAEVTEAEGPEAEAAEAEATEAEETSEEK